MARGGSLFGADLDALGLRARPLRFGQGDGQQAVLMGGYGHSRLREMILGGVTRYMLSSAPIAVLMAH